MPGGQPAIQFRQREIDAREEASGIPRLLAERFQAPVRVRALPVADYVLGDMGVERKTALDLARSIADGRAFDQARRLSAAFPRAALVVEGMFPPPACDGREEGYFGVRPGHTPLLASLGMGELKYRRGAEWHRLTCFSGWAEVLPDRVSILADIGERASEIDVGRAEEALRRAQDRMKQVKGEAGYDEVSDAYKRAVTRLAVARKERGGA